MSGVTYSLTHQVCHLRCRLHEQQSCWQEPEGRYGRTGAVQVSLLSSLLHDSVRPFQVVFVGPGLPLQSWVRASASKA